MTRLLVFGAGGQAATALLERAGPDVEAVTLGLPDVSIEDRERVLEAIGAARPDVVVNAAGYTAVDKAESEEEIATRVNCDGAGHVAEAAVRIGAPILHLSTDYVFDGALDRPYREDDWAKPIGAYGRSKLAGERRVAELNANSVVLRTAWMYSPFGNNFVRTMLRLGETRDEVGVVADQRGNPTAALDLADALLAVVRRIREDGSSELRGLFHLTGGGEATWADLAEAAFAEAHARGRPLTRVRRITTAEYPTPARRPANSRLDNAKFARVYGLALPNWRASLAACCARLVA
ncbi:MAG TPA: dTDP-4-dehydrorhamnose reductase [Roseiarcus sp.]|nr:dTDP-4-dehydrorhamnose reductase [Roseiarcus sp.]